MWCWYRDRMRRYVCRLYTAQLKRDQTLRTKSFSRSTEKQVVNVSLILAIYTSIPINVSKIMQLRSIGGYQHTKFVVKHIQAKPKWFRLTSSSQKRPRRCNSIPFYLCPRPSPSPSSHSLQYSPHSPYSSLVSHAHTSNPLIRRPSQSP